MTFIIDRHIGPRIVNVLKEMGVAACHLDEHFPQTAPDVVWVPEAAKRGWAVVSIDKKMNRNAEERKMLGQCGVLAFFLASDFAHFSAWKQLEYLAKCWPGIDAKAARPGGCRIYLVQINGKVIPFP